MNGGFLFLYYSLVKILGVDWGKKRIGLSVSEGGFAEPYAVASSVEELEGVIEKESVDRVLLGLPEGEHAEEVKELGKNIEKRLGIPVVLRSEILTTKQALEKAIKSGKSKKARRNLDSYSASILLQEYLNELAQKK
jgi:putative transcription antitermination factor YqgF